MYIVFILLHSLFNCEPNSKEFDVLSGMILSASDADIVTNKIRYMMMKTSIEIKTIMNFISKKYVDTLSVLIYSNATTK